MTDKLQLGALDTETNKYTSPTEALKGQTYKCVDCDKKVILRKGTIRKAHFAHYAQTNICSYYDHPNESQIHKDAKLLMVKLLEDKKRIQFCWECKYSSCKTSSDCYAFQDIPSIVYKEGDEVNVEYRDKDNKWIADVAIVNNGDVRYIIEIKNTHATTTARPEPWFEVDAKQFIQDINELNAEHLTDPDLDIYKQQEDFMYIIPCLRKDIARYCYGSFCYKERWVNKIPGYDKDLTFNECLICKSDDYEPVSDGCTDKFQNGEIRVCVNCLFNDTFTKSLRNTYSKISIIRSSPISSTPAPIKVFTSSPSISEDLSTREPCRGECFSQSSDCNYIQKRKCPENCKLIECPTCHKKYPQWLLDCKGGVCPGCDMDAYIVNNHLILLEVPFFRKEEAKELGARWHSQRKKWYIQKDAKNKDIVLSKFKLVR